MRTLPFVLMLTACSDSLGPTKLVPEPTETPCHQMACDDIRGTCVEVAVLDGTACDDGDACTTGDRCVAGTCIASPLSCDDGNACTADSCDPVTGCAQVPTTDTCDDGNACTENDTCGEGVCAGTARTCDDGNACTIDSCDPAIGCLAPPVEGLGQWCEALQATCAVGFACQDGTCASCSGESLYVPQGRFWMGCNDTTDMSCAGDESPQHRVMVPAFAMQKTEVTARAYTACVDAGGCTEPSAAGAYGTYGREDRLDHPITPVTWDQASAYCAWLDDRNEGGANNWRLCTEAEWEKAARGSCAVHCERADDDTCCREATPVFPWGDMPANCDLAIMNDGNINGCGLGVTAPVGSRQSPSAYGILDLAGNAREWVQDCWHPDYRDAPLDGSARDADACGPGGRVVRGGSAGDRARELRASERYFLAPNQAYDFNGFRCCRTLD